MRLLPKNNMEKVYHNCQSCGMPLKRDVQGGGTNADGSRSKIYCSKCYEGGAFTSPDITLEEMKVVVKSKLKTLGFPGFLSGVFTRNIPKLERWRNHDR
jgi:hypothetical protein